MSDAEPLRGKRVLVVEDEFFIAAGVARVLEMAGAEVVGPVPSVRQALAAIASAGRIDCALLDVNLGDETIDAVAVRLSELNVPFAFHTGYGSRKLPKGFETAEVLEKPALDEELVRTLARVAAGDSRTEPGTQPA